MGVDERLMAHSQDEAEDLFARIAARQAGPCPQGAHLTNALLLVMEQQLLRWRPLHPLAPILVRMLIGDKTAGMLGLNVRHPGLVGIAHRVIAWGFRASQLLFSPLPQNFQPGASLAAKLGRRIVDFLIRVTDQGRARQVAIPPEWG
jgi:hypothetical protein